MVVHTAVVREAVMTRPFGRERGPLVLCCVVGALLFVLQLLFGIEFVRPSSREVPCGSYPLDRVAFFWHGVCFFLALFQL